jgi:hypothetical protein
MFADRNQHFSSHMTTLLRPWRLVFDVYSRCSLLDEQLCELHHCSQSTVPGICVCDDGTEVVDVCEFGPFGFGFRGYTFFALLTVVEKLGHEEVGDFVWDSGLGELVCGFGEEKGGNQRRDNLPNLDRARRMQRR